MREAKPPSFANLSHLAKMLPNMTDGYLEGKIGGKGKSIMRWPKWRCPACQRLWGVVGETGAEPTEKPCRQCRKKCQAGWTLFVSPLHELLAIRPKDESHLQIKPELRGQIVKVSAHLFELMRQAVAGFRIEFDGPAAGSAPAGEPPAPGTGPAPAA